MQTKQKCHLFIETQIVSISGLSEKMQLETTAEWMIEGDVLTIQYQEKINEQSVFSHLQMDLNRNEVQLIRSGAVRFHHTFREGEATESPYENSYGYLIYGSDTKKIHLEMKNGKPDVLVLQYDSSFNDEKIGAFTVVHRLIDLVLPADSIEH